MEVVPPVREAVSHLIPAVTHVDGTGRLQTVDKKSNPSYYGVIKAFEKITEIPVVLNTSFNTVGEPIVETPEEAIRSFLKTGIDVLFVENRLLLKKQNI